MLRPTGLIALLCFSSVPPPCPVRPQLPSGPSTARPSPSLPPIFEPRPPAFPSSPSLRRPSSSSRKSTRSQLTGASLTPTSFSTASKPRPESKTGIRPPSSGTRGISPSPPSRRASSRRDGRAFELDPKTLTDVPAKNEEEDTFSDARIHKAPLPAVAIGAIVEQETVVQDKQPFFSGGSVYRVYFSRPVSVLRSRLIVEVPADAPFQARLHSIPDSASSSTQAGSVRSTVYDLNQVPLSLDSDIDLSTDQIREPFVEFSTGTSWASVAAAYQKLAEPQIQPDRIKSLLPTTLPSDYLASIQAIVSRLHKEIRYTGIEFGESALQPQNPTEILKRHYGDCKDKAAFLVAMLRASNIPANLALLDTGPGIDVNPDLPGMNQFDHAIVHVPAASGHPELWIDATAEFTHVGDLPYDDHGRLALIIADGTSALTRTPDAKPEDSVIVETRDFTLQQFGPAHVVESSATTGYIDADYRSRYGSAESKSTRHDLENYAKRVYNAKSLTKIEHTEGADLVKPFSLRLDIAQATRGTSSLVDSAVAIPQGPVNLLPSWFSRDPEDGAKPTEEQRADRVKAEQHRLSEYLLRPFIAEWRYRITLPDGFQPGTLPEDQTISVGPAILTRHFEAPTSGQTPQVVTTVLRFNSVKQRYTAEEVLAARKVILALNRQDFTLLVFNQVGAKLVADGKIRQGLAADRALIAGHPSEAIHHVQFSAALLSAGLGEQAQAEARRATELDPKSAIAFQQLGIALEYNKIGVFRAKGFDRAGALEAYRKAKQLDPDDTQVRTDLAVLLEFNANGDRYAEGANLPEAIREYRELQTLDKNAFAHDQDTLFFAMLYGHQYKELLTELATLPSNSARDAMTITCTAASQSSSAAIQRADHISGDSKQKAAAMRLAGFQLLNLNLYPQAADLLSASIQGQSDAAQIARQAEIFRSLSHTAPAKLTDARGAVQLMITSMMSDKPGATLVDVIPSILDRHAFASDAEWKKNLEHNENDLLETSARQSQLPPSVMRDLVLSNVKIAADGDDVRGFRVTLQSLGAERQNLFVTHDQGKYQIVASSTDSAEVGNYAAYLLAAHRDAEARNLLDWKRDSVHRGGGDDPLEGDLFARFWTSGDEPTPQTYQFAILALLLQKPWTQAPTADSALAAARAAYEKSPGDIDLALLLASASARRLDTAAETPYLNTLLAKYPNSNTALTMMGDALNRSHDYSAWRALLESHLAKRPADHDLLVLSAREAEAESDFPRARLEMQKVVDAAKPTANDYNSLAWLSLFDDHVDAASIDAAQHANSLSHNASFGDIHTLACLYAAQGKTAEARELLLKAMATTYQFEPNPEIWFGFGLIYEQYGLDDPAIAAFKKVPPPDMLPAPPTATYTRAQQHLKRLHAD